MIMNPAMTAGIGKLLRDMFAAQQGNTVRETQNIAFDPRFREVDLSKMLSGEDDMSAPIIPVEIQQLEKSEPVLSPEDILLDKEGFPVMRDEDSMQSEFDLPYILVPGGGRPEPQQPADMDIRDLLNMLFNRG